MTSSPFLTGRLRPPASLSSEPTAGRRIDPIAWSALAVAVGAVFTVLVLATTWLPAGYRLGPLSAEINAADGCVALLAGYLAHGRFVRDRYVRFGLIAQGLALFGAASLVLPAAMQLVPTGRAGSALVWAAAVVRLIASGLIAAGACAGDRRMRSRTPRGLAAAGPPAVLLLVLLVVGALASQLPPALIPVTPGGPEPLVFTSHPLLAGIQILSAVLLLAAAVMLTRLAVLHPFDVIGMMGPAFVLDGFALFQYALFPTLTTDWIYSGDVLRTGCYALLLVGAVVEIRRYWTGQSRVAVLADRRRLAREIHDGVVQEIAYIRMETRSLPQSDGADRIVDACDRALDEARDAVHALALSEAESLHHLLQRTAHDLSRRYGLDVRLLLDGDPQTDAIQRQGLVRIAREAVANAARHGRARTAIISLERNDDMWQLEILDDGDGFDPDTVGVTAGGYGLISMRERADALPGRCIVESRPGAGTTVRVAW